MPGLWYGVVSQMKALRLCRRWVLTGEHARNFCRERWLSGGADLVKRGLDNKPSKRATSLRAMDPGFKKTPL